MLSFALLQLDQILDESIRKIMASSELLLMVFSIVDYYDLPFDLQQSQYRIIQKIADNMNEARATDLIRRNGGLANLIKGFSSHNPRFQPIITNLITKLVTLGRRSMDVRTLFALTSQTSNQALAGLKDVALKLIVDLSENKEEEKGGMNHRHLESEFENFIPHLIDMSKSPQKYPSDFVRFSALQTLANLALRDYLRPQFFSHGAMELFIEVVRNQNASLNTVEAKRIAAKGLVNLVATRKDIRLQVVADLAEEIKLIYRNQLDPVVASYIQTLLHVNDS
jgi:hypothetical protein